MQSYAIICNQCRSRHKSPQGRVLNETPQLESNLGMTRNDERSERFEKEKTGWRDHGKIMDNVTICDNLVLIAFVPCKATNVMKVDIVILITRFQTKGSCQEYFRTTPENAWFRLQSPA